MKLSSILIVALMLFTLVSGAEDKEFKDKWSKEIKLEGANNFRKVSDVLYRSAQPDKDGMN